MKWDGIFYILSFFFFFYFAKLSFSYNGKLLIQFLNLLNKL